MLTARTTEDDVLLGLELGADDYMTKPYSPRELMARIRTVLRRSGRRAAADRRDDPVVRAGGLAVDPVRHEVRCDGAPVDCTPGEFEILLAMAAEPERVFSRRQLLERTRGIDRASTERAVDVHIMNLRKKIEADPRRPVRLLTVFGVGLQAQRRPRREPRRMPLRKSLLVRLLITSVLIAVCSVAATAWLAVQTTTRAIREEQGQVLADDMDILAAAQRLRGHPPRLVRRRRTPCASCPRGPAGASP